MQKFLLTCLFLILALPLRAQSFEELLLQLPEGSYSDRAEVASAIAATGDERTIDILETLADGNLHILKADGSVVIIRDVNGDDIAFSAINEAEIGPVGRRDTKKIKVNNGLRREIRTLIGSMSLQNADPAVRREAADAIYKSADPSQIPLLDAALENEIEDDIVDLLREARAVSVLNSDAEVDEKLAAVDIIAHRGGQDAQGVLSQFADDPDLAEPIAAALSRIKRNQQLWGVGQNVWYGLSLGSVLLLAAIGLAITFGVMGVINMAHGELVMLGAYSTFMVQELIRNNAAWLFDYSLLIAAPIAFLIAGTVGIGIERGIVRHLYGRPLETLLATWGVSLILQQTVRSIFGPNNREVGNPEWMSGAFELGGLTITYGRMWILIFSLIVFAGLMLLLKKTAMGLQMRAVTQNRAMAANMGIRTGRVDALTFGLGAGIAGLAGVALSQIDNVSPNLGQSYIVDSFMVVVFGGAGNLWGALAGAFSLGIANKFLEPWVGAVLAKILVLVFIILFIQKRPRGLFALKGRAVEA